MIEQRRLALAAYLAAAVTSSECCSDPALLAFLQMGAFRLKPADPIAATTGAVHAASEQPGAPSWGETKQVPPGQPVDSKYIPVEQVTSEMDVEDFVDFLLEKTALYLTPDPVSVLFFVFVFVFCPSSPKLVVDVRSEQCFYFRW